jgi:5-methyltetrahydrofolate--homocysteine methyltransferase
MNKISEVSELLVGGERDRLPLLIRELLNDGFLADDILYNGLIPGMDMVGDKMANEEMFIPEVLLSSLCMKEALDIIRPKLNQEKMAERKTVIIGTVRGDVHDIGKDLVINLLQGAGFDVIDLGINVPVENFVSAVKSKKPEILGMSAMLTTTMQEMRKVINALDTAGLRENIRVIVGGAPVNDKWAKEIGADAYGEDCVMAIRKIKQLIG